MKKTAKARFLEYAGIMTEKEIRETETGSQPRHWSHSCHDPDPSPSLQQALLRESWRPSGPNSDPLASARTPLVTESSLPSRMPTPYAELTSASCDHPTGREPGSASGSG